jgi:hypothetical protein
MDIFDNTSADFSFYQLYCFNKDCEGSVYHRNLVVEALFHAENLNAEHFCPCCDQIMLSKMDIEIKKMINECNLKAMTEMFCREIDQKRKHF